MVLKDKLDTMAIALKLKTENAIHSTKSFLSEKRNGDETLMVKIMLIVVAVALVLIFKDKIREILNTMFGKANGQIDGMFDPTK